MEYERAFTSSMGLAIRSNIVSDWEWKGGKNENEAGDDYDWIYSVDGYGAGLSARFYPWGKAPEGFHIGPRCDYISFYGTYEDRARNRETVDTSMTLGTAHFEIGYKDVLGGFLVMGTFVDFGYAFARSVDASSLLALTYIFGGGIYIGAAF
ncbi:hypothetical protein JW933_05465 [candidate division FCPU426 bacterium]|nr:hypothetical protein [candidate division FCPU426 bacterium]